jgi:NADH dehydrogenase
MILVTGGTGFVGMNLVRALSEKHRVRCLARDRGRAERRIGALSETVRGDVTDAAAVMSAVTPDVDTVIHLVGILAEPPGRTFHDIHTQGTINVVRACQARGVGRYLHMSALGTRANARSRYHRTKWEAEEFVRASGLDYTIFRPSVIFGADDKFTNLFAGSIRRLPAVAIPGDGQNRFQPVFVGDVVRAFVRSLDPDHACSGLTLELGGPEAYTFDQVMDRIAGALGRRRIRKIHIPMALMRAGATLAERVLSAPPITRDQLLMLEEDNVTAHNALVEVFGIDPVGFTEGMRTYLH